MISAISTQAQQPPAAKADTIYVYEAVSSAFPHSKEAPAIYVDGKLVHSSIMAGLKPEGIDSLTVDKGYREIYGKKYDGALYIYLKKDYIPDLISLNEIKKKYTKLGNQTVLFMIDGKAIQDDYDQYQLDKSRIISLTIEPIKNTTAKLDLTLLKLVTNTPMILKGEGGFRIRGNESPLIGTE